MVKKTKKQNGGDGSVPKGVMGAMGNFGSSMKRRSMKSPFGSTLKRRSSEKQSNPTIGPALFSPFASSSLGLGYLKKPVVRDQAEILPKLTAPAELQKVVPTETTAKTATTAELQKVVPTETTALIESTLTPAPKALPTLITPAEELIASTLAKTIVSAPKELTPNKFGEYINFEANVPRDTGYIKFDTIEDPKVSKAKNTQGSYIDVNTPTNNNYLKIFPSNYKNNKKKQEVYKILTDKATRASNFSARITRINPEALSKFETDNARLSYFKSNFSPEMATKINEFFSKELQNITNQKEKQTIIQEILNDFKSKALTNNNTRKIINNNTKKFLNTKRNQNTKTGKTARSKSITNEIKKIRNEGYSKLNPAQRSTTSSTSSTSPISTEYSVLERQ
jgi:hypothetical protein